MQDHPYSIVATASPQFTDHPITRNGDAISDVARNCIARHHDAYLLNVFTSSNRLGGGDVR